MIYLPPPPVAIVRTVEELGIQQPSIIDKIIKTANNVLYKYENESKTPVYNGVEFDGASLRNRCQQNVRQLLEASFILKNNEWQEASCCAGSTMQNMHISSANGKYIEIKNIYSVRKGDIVYLGGGGICSDCGYHVGHVMVCTGRAKDGTLLMWQNTTLGDRKLCEIPIIQAQSDRFIAAYRFRPLDVKNKIVYNKIEIFKFMKQNSILMPKKQDNITINFNIMQIINEKKGE